MSLLDTFEIHESPKIVDTDPMELINPDIDDGPWIAGGHARRMFTKSSDPEADIDVWCKSIEQYTELDYKLRSHPGFFQAIDSNNALSYVGDSGSGRITIQLIKELFNSPEDVINSFDITVCQIITDGYRYILGEHTAADLNSKTLRYRHQTLKPEIIPRFMKYIVYGFTPDEHLLSLIENEQTTIVWNTTSSY